MYQDDLLEKIEFRTIGEAAELLQLPQHVLRFWEDQFPGHIKPVKRRGGRRFYNQDNVEAIRIVKALLHERGLTIKGAKKFLSNVRISDIKPGSAEKILNNQGYISGKAVTQQPKAVAPVVNKTTAQAKISDKKKADLIKLRNELNQLQETFSD